MSEENPTEEPGHEFQKPEGRAVRVRVHNGRIALSDVETGETLLAPSPLFWQVDARSDRAELYLGGRLVTPPAGVPAPTPGFFDIPAPPAPSGEKFLDLKLVCGGDVSDFALWDAASDTRMGRVRSVMYQVDECSPSGSVWIEVAGVDMDVIGFTAETDAP